MGRRWALVGAAALLLLTGCVAHPTQSEESSASGGEGGAAASTSPSVTVSADRPCAAAPAPAAWDHVIWIWFENKPETGIIGSPDASYITTLAASCALATDYHGVAHPSLPNYLAATSGSTNGVADDGAPAAHPLTGPSLFGQVSAADKEWRSYEESMPSACALTSSGTYAVKHNPAAYFTSVRSDCARWDVGLDQLDADLAADHLPAFALVTPDLCHDMHDCSVSAGDTWLRRTLPTLLSSSVYAHGTTAILITWDEDDSAHDNRVPLLVVAPSVAPETRIGVKLDHYSLLRTTEQMLGLPLLGSAAQATSIPGL